MVAQKQPISHFNALINNFQFLGGQGYSKHFVSFSAVSKMPFYYMSIIWGM